MLRKIFKILFIIFLFVINCGLVYRAYTMCQVYPFTRLMLQNKLHFTSVFHDVGTYYDSEIVALDEKKVSPDTGLQQLYDQRYEVSLVHLRLHDGSYEDIPVAHSFNYNVFALLMLLILFADVCCLWAVVVRLIHPEYDSSKLYSDYCISLGLYFFSITTYFLIQGLPLYLYLSMGLVAFQIYKTGVTVSLQQTKQEFKHYYTLIMIVLIFISVIFLFFLDMKNQFVYLYTLIILSCFFSMGMIFSKIMHSSNVLIRKGMIIFVLALCSIIIPFSLMTISLYCDLKIPISFITILLLVMPLVFGNNLINEIISSSFTIKKRYPLKLLIDVAISIIVAVSYIYVLSFQVSLISRLLLYGCNIVMLFLVLRTRTLLLSYIKRITLKKKDLYSVSLQKITERSASPIDIAIRLEDIFDELNSILQVAYLKIMIFDFYMKEKVEGVEKYLGYITQDSPLGRYYLNNKVPITKKSFFAGFVFESILEGIVEKEKIDLIVPIQIKQNIAGVVLSGEKNSGLSLNENEMSYLDAAAVLVYQMVENEILFSQYLLKRKYEKELDISSYIQIRLFPKKVPLKRGLDITFYSRPYIKVTGDYFDFVEIDEEKTAVIIGDVAGHGLPAAMILSVTGSILIAMLKEGKNIRDAFKEVNHFLTERYSGIELITLFIGVFDKVQMKMSYINAGHCSPLLLRKGDGMISYLEHKNLILGVSSDTKYDVAYCNLYSGDEIILYTDGLVEISDAKNEFDLGEGMLNSIILKNLDKSIEDKIESFTDYLDHLGADLIRDDITIIGIEIE